MKAAFLTAPRTLELRDIGDPAAPEDGLVLDVKACGICGSDLRRWKEGPPPGVAGMIPGHEAAGIVVATGKAQSRFAVGDRIAIAPDVHCGRCYYCHRGLYNLCDEIRFVGVTPGLPGALAEKLVLTGEVLINGIVHPMPEGMSFVEGSLAEPSCSVLASHDRAGTGLGDTVVIMGAGPIGCLHVIVAKARGARVVVSEPSPVRRQLAERCGPEAVVDPRAEDLGSRVRQMTAGVGADIVVCANPMAETQTQAVQIVRKRGRVILFGGLPKANPMVTLDSNRIHYGEIEVVGAFSYHPTAHARALDLIQRKVIDADLLVTHTFGLDDIAPAFEAAAGGAALKVVIVTEEDKNTVIGMNEELAARAAAGNPVKIGLIGAGQMGVDIVAQVAMMKGIDIVVVADLDKARAQAAYATGLLPGDCVEARTAAAADAAVAGGKRVYTDDFRVVTGMKQVDVMLEATGVPEVGTKAALLAARHGQQLAMMNVETDITVGPLLHWYAQRKGVLYALAAGDEPAACKELYDFAEALGFTIVAAGKGKNNPLDRHAQPTDEAWAKEAARRGLNPNMLIEFVDGSKTMIEMAAVSNATGLRPDVRGMHGPKTTRDKLSETFALQEHGGILSRVGVVEYGIGGIHPGVFLVVTTSHPRLRQALVYRDMGNGPYYTLFRPYHLCSIEVPLTCAMLAIRRKSNMFPLDRLVSEVFAVAKRDLRAGDRLDGIGGCSFYSLIDTYEAAVAENLLPVGLAKGAILNKAVPRDRPIRYEDVRLYEPSTVLTLRRLQDAWTAGKIDEQRLLESIEAIESES